MKSKKEIIFIADAKFEEAKCLLDNGFYNGSIYIGGYAIELLLKAKVCLTLHIDDFFLFDKIRQEAYKPFKSHNYDQLLLLSGLYNDLYIINAKNEQLQEHWSLISIWNENLRYNIGYGLQEAQTFITSLKEVMIWIKKHL